jgi:hypothetical protein
MTEASNTSASTAITNVQAKRPPKEGSANGRIDPD